MLAWLITRYQRSPLINRGVRLAVRIHHRLRPAKRGPCPLTGRCSATGLARARVLGWAALPVILARMSVCSCDDEPHDPGPQRGQGHRYGS